MRNLSFGITVCTVLILTVCAIGCEGNDAGEINPTHAESPTGNLTPTFSPSPEPSPTPIITPSPTPSPTPEATVSPGTPAPVGEELFSDDFTNCDNWFAYSDAEGVGYCTGGRLHVKNRGIAEGSALCYARAYYGDFVLDVEVEMVQGNDNEEEDDEWCIIAGRGNSYRGYGYQFGISSDGSYAIFKQSDLDAMEQLQLIASSPYINKGVGAVNLVRVECIGNTLRLSVNGHVLAEVSDNTFTEGSIALGSGTFSDGQAVEFAFDSVLISKPLD